MRIRSILRWLAVPLLFLSFQLCHAQSVSLDIDGENGNALWDLSGNYNLDLEVAQPNGDQTEMILSFNMTQDSTGHLHGPVNPDWQQLTLIDSSATTTNYFTVRYLVVGKVNGANGNARARFTIFLFGNGTLGGKNVNAFAGKITVDALPGGGVLAGTFPNNTKVSFNFGKLGSMRGIADFNTALPENVDGTWNLSMQFSDLRSKLVGTGTITTSTGQVMGFNVGGAFKNEQYTVDLRGAGDVPNITIPGFGSSAVVHLDSELDFEGFVGKVMGQSFFFAVQ